MRVLPGEVAYKLSGVLEVSGGLRSRFGITDPADHIPQTWAAPSTATFDKRAESLPDFVFLFPLDLHVTRRGRLLTRYGFDIGRAQAVNLKHMVDPHRDGLLQAVVQRTDDVGDSERTQAFFSPVFCSQVVLILRASS